MDRSWLQSAWLPEGTEALRLEIRAFLTDALASVPLEKRALSWAGADTEFSRAMGRRGLIGMTWPQPYGQGRSPLDRYVLAEELLAAGAPVAAHWTADRQVGPTLLKFGTEAQRQRFLPAIAAGELFVCVGLSEPDSGSDLASVRCRARRAEGGWRLTGTKLWITHAHLCGYMLALVRTGEAGERHKGLTQLMVDLGAEGVTVRPIRDLTGGEHFAEVVFEDTFVPDDMLVGTEGEAWRQVMAELSNERSGPERYLSAFPVLAAAMDAIGAADMPQAEDQVGGLVADLLSLRAMSIGVARTLEAGQDPSVPAALVKDAGSVVEQRIPHLVRELTGLRLVADGDELERALTALTQISTVFSLRGGTREILKGIIARQLVQSS